jgi:hypothetical protein
MNIIKIPLNPPLLKGEVKAAIFVSIPFYTLKGTFLDCGFFLPRNRQSRRVVDWRDRIRCAHCPATLRFGDNIQ